MFSPWSVDSVTEKYTFPDGKSISRQEPGMGIRHDLTV